MKGLKTKQFFRSLYASIAFSALFLSCMLLYGKELAALCFDGVALSLFAVMGIAILSFVAFCFVPYFHGDRRWFVIPSMLTVVFFIGAALIWQVPMEGLGG